MQLHEKEEEGVGVLEVEVASQAFPMVWGSVDARWRREEKEAGEEEEEEERDEEGREEGEEKRRM